MKKIYSGTTYVVSLILLCFLGVPAWADEPAPPPPNTGALSMTINLNFPTAYFFRGIAQSNAGLMFEPYVELKANLYGGGEKDVLTDGYLKVAGFSHFNSVAPPFERTTTSRTSTSRPAWFSGSV